MKNLQETIFLRLRIEVGARHVSSMAKPAKSRVKAIHSSEAAARDEGPRLIPLRNEPTDVPLGHYLQLADTALGTIPTKRPRKSASKDKKQDGSTLERS